MTTEKGKTMSETEPNEWSELIAAERQRQLARGYDQAHDDQHGVDHLLMWAQEYARRSEPVKSAALIEAAREALFRVTTPTEADREAFAKELVTGEAWQGIRTMDVWPIVDAAFSYFSRHPQPETEWEYAGDHGDGSLCLCDSLADALVGHSRESVVKRAVGPWLPVDPEEA